MARLDSTSSKSRYAFPEFMSKRPSSRRWLTEHHNDDYVRRAREAGYRSRAAYKLLEIDARDGLLQPGMTVVDLGAAPGGWSQVAARAVGPQGRVLALDLLPMAPLPGVEFIQGDFHEQAVYEALLARLPDGRVDLVLSDMAPNISGVAAVDQPRSIYLVESAAEFASRVLRSGGVLLAKAFQGSGFQELVRELHSDYVQVVVRKPKSSRPRSREVYLLARGLRGK